MARAVSAAAVEQAAARLARDPDQAAEDARALLGHAPNDPRLLLILGSALRRQGRFAEAKAALAPLAQAWPRAANTHYELGLTLSALGDALDAQDALRRAVSADPNHAGAWRALGDLLFGAGDAAGAEAAFAEHRRATVTDPALRPAAEAIFAGRIVEAEKLLRAHLTRRLGDAAATRMLAEVYLRLDRFADAEILFERALELEPHHDGARFGLADARFRQQKAVAAIPELEDLLTRAPDDPAYRNLLAACLALIGEDERVIALYQQLLADYPTQPRLWLNHGHALRAIGRRDEAVAAFRRALALDPTLGDAYWSLANLKVAPLTEGDQAAMRRLLAQPRLRDDDRLHLHYALGKALEDRGQPAEAFSHYASGAAIRRRQGAYSADETTALTLRIRATFTPDLFAAQRGAGAASAAPIFIVGLPRAGSTLVEQILASHSQVEGTMELPDLGLIAREFGPDYPEAVVQLTAAELTALGTRYLAATQAHRKLGRPFFIDKMPNNFQHIGLIRLILPNARIIDARRHPMAAGFSVFKQHFAQGQSFSYDLSDIGRYYRDYVGLMAHFDQALPGPTHRVVYEDLVQDTEAETRRLLAYCGLEFEPACLRFFETRRAVRTVSSEQVRRPIYRESLEQWRAYEPWLDPLKAALGPALETWRD